MDIIPVRAFNNKKNYNGYGLKFDQFVITANHVVKSNIGELDTNIENYNRLYEVNPYDLCFLINNKNINQDINQDNNQDTIDEIKMLFRKRLYGLEYFKLDEIYQFIESKQEFKIKIDDFDLQIKIIDVVLSNVNSVLYPDIPIIKCSIDYSNKETLNGMSGYMLSYTNKLIGMMLSVSPDNTIDMIPFDIISIIVQNGITSSEFPYLNLKYKKCKIQNEKNEIINALQIINRKTINSFTFKKNTFIVEIEGMKFNNKYKIKFKNTLVDINTYILLTHHISGLTLNESGDYNRFSIEVNKFSTSELSIKTVSFRELNKIKYYNYVFSEINEEYIFEMIKRGNLNIDLNLNTLLESKSHNNIILLNLPKTFNHTNIYFLEKIGNVNIKSINNIKKIKNLKQIVLKDELNNFINL
jgi:hypothetical protein